MDITISDNNKEWKGNIDIKELNEHLCIAELESRDSAFTIAMSCYFDKYGMQEWCLCVPNWNFGCKISPLEKGWNEEQIEKYIPNRTDRKSLTEGVWQLFKAIEQQKREKELGERKEEQQREQKRNELREKNAKTR